MLDLKEILNIVICGDALNVLKTLLVAKKIQRNYIGIELSKKYCKMVEERIRKECGGYFDV